MNAPHEEAMEFAKQSKRENRVYVGNLSYDVKYRDLMEFMRGGGLGDLRLVFCCSNGRFGRGSSVASRSSWGSQKSIVRGAGAELWSFWFTDGMAS